VLLHLVANRFAMHQAYLYHNWIPEKLLRQISFFVCAYFEMQKYHLQSIPPIVCVIELKQKWLPHIRSSHFLILE
jgi:hypothetical protein